MKKTGLILTICSLLILSSKSYSQDLKVKLKTGITQNSNEKELKRDSDSTHSIEARASHFFWERISLDIGFGYSFQKGRYLKENRIGSVDSENRGVFLSFSAHYHAQSFKFGIETVVPALGEKHTPRTENFIKTGPSIGYLINNNVEIGSELLIGNSGSLTPSISLTVNFGDKLLKNLFPRKTQAHPKIKTKEFTVSGYKFNSFYIPLYKKLSFSNWLGDLISDCTPVKVTLVGHTDLYGDDQYNHELGLKRALEVQKISESLNVPHEIHIVSSEGKNMPVIPIKRIDINELNRRVEVKVFCEFLDN